VDAILAVVDAADGERVETAWSAREAHRSSRDRADTAIAR
jgi:hypothetical protein